MKKKLLGLFFCTKEQIKLEYFTPNLDKKFPLMIVEVYSNKKYGAIAKIEDGRLSRSKMFKGFKKGKKIKKIDWDKPVDTSKWVKPDEESIRNALVTELFATIILKEDSVNYNHHNTRMKLLYSILHSHSPNNPQGLSNFGIFFPVQTILNEFKVPEAKKMYEILFGKDGKKHFDDKRYVKRDNWEKNILRKMISKGLTPMA